ncbi:MAG: NAD(P)-binding protein [Erysipelotrichaceae bacterium]
MSDVVIIGGGIGGLMCAYRLIEKNPKLNITLLEQGNDIIDRHCPIINHQVNSCIHCSKCAIMEGLAGAGAFSDGKYIISTEYGGWLNDFIGNEQLMQYIHQADEILMKYGATKDVYHPSDDLKKKCLEYDLHMLQAQVKHLGTDENFKTMAKMIADLKNKIKIITLARVSDINKDNNEVTYIYNNSEHKIVGKHIVIAVGRVGSKFLANWCHDNGIELLNNQVDIGVRVEVPSLIWKDFSSKIYEPKIWYRSKAYGDITRMFCFNDRGYVVTENTGGILSVNGHSFKEEEFKSNNSNFALLSTIKFTEPFNEPIEYARQVAHLANLISGGSVLVQRFGDLINGRRTDEKRLSQSTTIPTLNGVAGDLSLCLPKRQLDNIIETIYALDKIAPGMANSDTLLYGIECKYYSARPKFDEHFQLDKCHNIYVVGDGAGVTRSLSQASANGLYVGDKILKQ